MKNKNLLEKLAFALTGILFFIGGLLIISEDNLLLAVILLLASLPNISRVRQLKERRSTEKVSSSILIMNVIVCISVGLDDDLSYVQYVWFFAALVSFIALVDQIRNI